jgi:hypothetical protein
MEAEWLTEDSRFLLIGQIYPEWELRKALLGVIERDQAGHYFISNEESGLYAVGFSHDEALIDFKQTLLDNYERLEARAGEDSDLQLLLWKYQKYLKRPSSPVV